jgi:hypothetical protein
MKLWLTIGLAIAILLSLLGFLILDSVIEDRLASEIKYNIYNSELDLSFDYDELDFSLFSCSVEFRNSELRYHDLADFSVNIDKAVFDFGLMDAMSMVFDEDYIVNNIDLEYYGVVFSQGGAALLIDNIRLSADNDNEELDLQYEIPSEDISFMLEVDGVRFIGGQLLENIRFDFDLERVLSIDELRLDLRYDASDNSLILEELEYIAQDSRIDARGKLEFLGSQLDHLRPVSISFDSRVRLNNGDRYMAGNLADVSVGTVNASMSVAADFDSEGMPKSELPDGEFSINLDYLSLPDTMLPWTMRYYLSQEERGKSPRIALRNLRLEGSSRDEVLRIVDTGFESNFGNVSLNAEIVEDSRRFSEPYFKHCELRLSEMKAISRQFISEEVLAASDYASVVGNSITFKFAGDVDNPRLISVE